MKTLLISLALLVSVSACGSDESPYTWGQASQEVSDAYCTALLTCGFAGSAADTAEDSAKWVASCAGHTKYHLCDVAMSCDAELEADAEAIVETCVTELGGELFHDWASNECFFLGFYGAVPESCGLFLALDPANQPEE